MTEPDTYKCAECSEIFNKGWSNAEASDEKETNYGAMPDEDMAIVCDDCFNEIRTNTLLVLARHQGHGIGEDA